MILAAAMLTAILAPQTPGTTAACLHDPATESAEQLQRRRAAVAAARAINTLESKYAAAHQHQYAQPADLEPLAVSMGGQLGFSLRPGTEVVPGFQLTLDVTTKGYWFEIKDTMDPCGFRYISNQDGLIFTAQPMR
jgi:hypothetical protein